MMMNSRKMAMVMLATVLSSLKVLAQEEGDVNERALKYGVINFEFPPYLYYDKETNLPYKGFFYDVLQGFGKQLNRTIELVPVPDFFTDLDITAFMSRRIREGMIDFGWSNRADFGRDVAENMSYAGVWQFDHYVAVGKKTTRERSGYTQFLEPFSNGVWFTILGSISLGGLVITVLLMNNNHMNNEFKDKHLKREGGLLQFTKITLRSLYHTFAAVLGAESAEFEYEMVSASLLGRLFRLGLLFLVLMVGATYTANLASFLIQSNASIYHGPTTFEELKQSTACIQQTIATPLIEPYVGKNAPNPLTVAEQANQTLTESWTHGALMRGECDVIIRPAAYNYILPEVECDRSYVIPGLTIAAQQWYQFTAGETLEQRNFARKAHAAMDGFVQTAEYQRLYAEAFGSGAACSIETSNESETGIVEVKHLGGVFIIYGVVCAFVLLCSFFQALHNATFGRMRHQNKRTKDDSAHDDGIRIDTVNDKKYYEGEEDLTTDMDELIRLVSRLKRSRAARTQSFGRR